LAIKVFPLVRRRAAKAFLGFFITGKTLVRTNRAHRPFSFKIAFQALTLRREISKRGKSTSLTILFINTSAAFIRTL
jgi:hypothetical protein